MSENIPLPLTDPQARRLGIILAILERDLQQLRETLAHGPRDMRLSRFNDPVNPQAAPQLERGLVEAEKQLVKIADDLGLAPSSESVCRGVLARLELDIVDLYDAHPAAGLRGYGEVAVPTARYLDTELSRLEILTDRIIRLLRQSVCPPP